MTSFWLMLAIGCAGLAQAAGEVPQAPRQTAPKKVTPANRAASRPDLSIQLEGPSRAAVGLPLADFRTTVKNNDDIVSQIYRVEIELRTPAGSPLLLGGESGKVLGPKALRTHGFGSRRLAVQIVPGHYQLCARVVSGADTVKENDELCRAFEVVAAEGRRGAATGIGAPPAKRPAQVTTPPAAMIPRVAIPTTTAGASASSPTFQASLATRQVRYRDLARVRQSAAATMRARSVLELLAARGAEAAYAASAHGNDCDDGRRDVYPGAAEICDGVDNNCDGRVDEGQTLLAYCDADGDGHGDPATALDVCPEDFRRAQEAGNWLSLTGNDCDDSDPARWHDCN